MKIIVFIFSLTILAIIVWLLISNNDKKTPTSSRFGDNLSSQTQTSSPVVIADKLEIPWSIAFLPDGSMLITERPGRVRLIDASGVLQEDPIASFQNVKAIGEGGLLGIALHPDFATNNYIYLYYFYEDQAKNTLNRVVRMTYLNKQLNDEQIIVDKIPGSSNHNGGRIKFGPDDYLYITTGDAQNSSQAQDINSLSGKILRVTDEGEPVSDNPFNNLIFSYGHRNPQGLAWDADNRLWTTEHGRSGIASGLDELNLIEKGKNYGWPDIEGSETKTDMVTPKLHSGSDTTWAPAGATFINNSLFFAGLRSETLFQAIVTDDSVTLKAHFKGEFGRIRDVVLGPDNYLYITTSNKDGRGNPTPLDDRIIKIDPNLLVLE